MRGQSEMSDDLSPRDRRRQQAKGSRTKDVKGATGSVLKKAAPLIVILAIAGFVVAGFVIQKDRLDNLECPGHWHSTMKVYIDGSEVRFDGYNLESGTTPMSNHFHRGDSQKWLWHFEPGIPRCIEFEDAARDIDVDVSKDRIRLTGAHEAQPWGGTHQAEGDKKVQAFHNVHGDWESISISKLNKRQLVDGEQLLILYGDYGEEEISNFQGSVPPAGQQGPAPGHPAG